MRLGFTPLHPSVTLIVGVAITTLAWIAVTLMTPPTDRATLQKFYDKIRPLGPGWNAAVETRPTSSHESLTAAFLCWFLGCVVVYAALFGTGFLLYGSPLPALASFALLAAAGVGLLKTVPKVGFWT